MKKRILVIDKDNIFKEGTLSLFGDGYEWMHSSRSEEALAKAIVDRPDVIFYIQSVEDQSVAGPFFVLGKSLASHYVTRTIPIVVCGPCGIKAYSFHPLSEGVLDFLSIAKTISPNLSSDSRVSSLAGLTC